VRAFGLILCLLSAARPSASAVIDRVLAVVQGSIVTLSDVNAAIALGLVNTAGAADPTASALEQLIERSLQLAEVERYAPPEPAAEEIAARVRRIHQRFESEDDLQRTLSVLGLTTERLNAIARDDLRLEAYLNQRFAPVTDPPEEEVSRYYREHQREFIRGGVLLSLGQVAGEIRRRLETALRAERIDEWSRQLRLRADVLVIPRS
jgi:hypothetical protein